VRIKCLINNVDLLIVTVESESDLITEDKPFFNPKFTH